MRIKLVAPSDYDIKSDLSNLGFEFVKTDEITTKCTNINQADGSRAAEDNHRPGDHGSDKTGVRYHTFGTVNDSPQLRIDKVFVKLSELGSTEEYKLCVEIPYQRPGSSEILYSYVATDMEFTKAPPKITSITFPSTHYTAADIGTRIKIVFSVDRPVKVVSADKAGLFPPQMYVNHRIWNVGNNNMWSTNQITFGVISPLDTLSNEIVFGAWLGFDVANNENSKWNDEWYKASQLGIEAYYTQILLLSLAEGSPGNRPPANNIVDAYGRKIVGDSVNRIYLPDVDINDFEITFDMAPIVTLKQVSDGLDIIHTPEQYTLIGPNGPTASPKYKTITASWSLRKSTTQPKTTDKCKAGEFVTSGTKNQIKSRIPAISDNMWYCVHTNDIAGRRAASSWMQYIVDETGPIIAHTVINNQLTLTVTDTGTGYKDGSLRWGALGFDQKCVDGFAGNFDNSAMTITITKELDNRAICAKASDNAGNETYKQIILKYNQSTTITDTDDEEPESTTDDNTDKDKDEDKTPTTTPTDDSDKTTVIAQDDNNNDTTDTMDDDDNTDEDMDDDNTETTDDTDTQTTPSDDDNNNADDEDTIKDEDEDDDEDKSDTTEDEDNNNSFLIILIILVLIIIAIIILVIAKNKNKNQI